MSTNWTPDQEKAINSVDKATIVSAAAGSGKTAVLVERTIRMLTDPSMNIEADRLLAVTFTNDAASNMKEKLNTAMNRMLEENPENSWVSKQKDLLSLATICTIDSFCMDLVKNNLNDLDVSSGFTVLDQQEEKILVRNSFEEASEYFLVNHQDKMKKVIDNFAEINDDEILEYGQLLFELKGSLPFPQQWKKMAYKNQEDYLYGLNELLFETKIAPFIKAVRNSIPVLEKNVVNMEKPEKYADVISKYKAFAEKFSDEVYKNNDCLEVIKSPEFDAVCKVKYPPKPNYKKLEANPTLNDATVLVYGVKDSITDGCKKIRTLSALSQAEIDKIISSSREIFDCLWDFVLKAEEILWEKKLEKNKFSFSDITRLTIKLLARELDEGYEKTELSKRITDEKRYKIILIDEFQDVNNLQDVIFKCISDTDDMSVLGRNVFVVGDMKQSIYSFRQSNPEIFINTRASSLLPENSHRCNAVYLKNNFRSRNNILDFTNFVFENVMSKELGEVDYDSNERLALGAEYKGDDFSTDVILYTDLCDDKDSDDGEENSDTINKEALIVAKKVRKMLDEKTLVYDNKQLRPCRPGDFCVLLRKNEMTNDYIKAFDLEGISAVGDSVKGYLGAREISLALSILRILDNPMNDIPFVAVCMSPIFGFTADEISTIRQINTNKKFYSLFLGIARDEKASEYGYEPIDIHDEELTKKCTRAVEIIKRLRFYASGMSLEKLVRKVYDVTDLMSVASSYENSQQKRANLRMLVKYAEKYEKSTGGGLSDFLRYLDNVSKMKNDFDEALTVSAGEDTVSIKTIHKSKGLEYPFVILGGTTKEYFPPSYKKVVFNGKFGFGMTLRDVNSKSNFKNPLYNYCVQKNLMEQKSEELRILYVALTRAKEKLIIPLSLKSKGKGRIKSLLKNLNEKNCLDVNDLKKLNSYSEILFACLLLCANYVDKDMIESLFKLEISHSVALKKVPDIILESENDYLSLTQSDKTEFVMAKPDNSLVSKIIDSISFEENQEDTQTVSKLSVTEFIREIKEGNAQKEITYFPPVPDVGDEKRKATSAEKGTDTHLFMELCDFEKASNDVKSEIDRLKSSMMLSVAQAENVDLNAVSSFFESEVYWLCKSAQRIHREKDFKVKLSDMRLDNSPLEVYNDKDVMVQGIADLIIENEDSIVIVDYKTDNVKSPSELVDRHFVQLLLYKKAFELIFDKPVSECYIYSFRLRNSIKIDFESLQNLNKNP